jgi:hypothetical protein
VESVKTYTDTYVWTKYPDYEKKIFAYLMHCEVVNKQSEAFQDAVYEVKKRATAPAFVDCMNSANVVFVHGDILKPFVVLTAKDVGRKGIGECAEQYGVQESKNVKQPDLIKTLNDARPPKEPKKPKDPKIVKEDTNFIPFSVPFTLVGEEVATTAPLKVFINVDLYKVFDKDRLKSPELLITLLNNAIVQLMYYKVPKRLFGAYSCIESATRAWTKLFIYIIDFMAKIGVMGETVKNKAEYAAAKYFLSNVACVSNDPFTNSDRNRCIKIAGISNREADLIDASIQDEDYQDIKLFISAFAEYLKIPNLTIETFIDRWMYAWGGPQTAFALEYFPSFSQMLTDAYHGCYLNNQKTIEKLAGDDMVEYCKSVVQLAR